MKTVSIQELTNLLDARRGACFVTIVARVDAKLVKKHRETGEPNPYAGATKVSRVNGCINWSYANSVNNQRLREGQPTNEADQVEFFTPEKRAWGQRRFYNAAGEAVYDRSASVRLSPFVDHKQAVYLEMKVEKSVEHRYELDGEVLTDEQVAPYLPKRKESSRQQVEKPVILRDYTLDKAGETSIMALTMGGETYHVA